MICDETIEVRSRSAASRSLKPRNARQKVLVVERGFGFIERVFVTGINLVILNRTAFSFYTN